MAALDRKKVAVAAVLGAVLFLASFLVAEKMNAQSLFCGLGTDIFGAPIEAPGCGEPAPAPGGQVMVASYYGWAHAGNPTASGEIFQPMGHTAAHKTMPFGTQLRVTHGGSSAVVTVNDRGPYIDGRDLDVSQGAAESIGLTGPGVAPVEVTVL